VTSGIDPAGLMGDLADAIRRAQFGTEAFSAAFTESFSEWPEVEAYRYPIPFRCSAECGRPVRIGELFIQTSPDLRPLTRAHAACVIGRKGIEPVEPQTVVAA
jgi:hypothetical protein